MAVLGLQPHHWQSSSTGPTSVFKTPKREIASRGTLANPLHDHPEWCGPWLERSRGRHHPRAPCDYGTFHFK
jgi:hypothetical protein